MALITKEEHIQASEIRQKQQQVQFELGAIVIAEEEIKSRKEFLLSELNQQSENLNDFMKGLAEKYGHGTLNIETGEFTVNEQVTE